MRLRRITFPFLTLGFGRVINIVYSKTHNNKLSHQIESTVLYPEFITKAGSYVEDESSEDGGDSW